MNNQNFFNSPNKEMGDHDDPIQFKLDYCMENVKGNAVGFIESLQEWYDEHGELTEAQEAALDKFFDRC